MKDKIIRYGDKKYLCKVSLDKTSIFMFTLIGVVLGFLFKQSLVLSIIIGLLAYIPLLFNPNLILDFKPIREIGDIHD